MSSKKNIHHGLATPLAAVPLVGTMLVALVTAKALFRRWASSSAPGHALPVSSR